MEIAALRLKAFGQNSLLLKWNSEWEHLMGRENTNREVWAKYSLDFNYQSDEDKAQGSFVLL